MSLRSRFIGACGFPPLIHYEKTAPFHQFVFLGMMEIAGFFQGLNIPALAVDSATLPPVASERSPLSIRSKENGQVVEGPRYDREDI